MPRWLWWMCHYWTTLSFFPLPLWKEAAGKHTLHRQEVGASCAEVFISWWDNPPWCNNLNAAGWNLLLFAQLGIHCCRQKIWTALMVGSAPRSAIRSMVNCSAQQRRLSLAMGLTLPGSIMQTSGIKMGGDSTCAFFVTITKVPLNTSVVQASLRVTPVALTAFLPATLTTDSYWGASSLANTSQNIYSSERKDLSLDLESTSWSQLLWVRRDNEAGATPPVVCTKLSQSVEVCRNVRADIANQGGLVQLQLPSCLYPSVF